MTFNRSFSFALGVAVAMVMAGPVGAQAADIKILCSSVFKAVMEELVPQFERATHHKAVVRYGLAAVLKQQIEAGEAFELLLR